MNQTTRNISFVALTMLLASCQFLAYKGDARDVKRRPQEGGTVAIRRNFRPEDRAKAEETMTSVCAPRPFHIVEEGEVVTGQETVSNVHETRRDSTEQNAGTFLGMPVTTGEKGGKDASTTSASKDLKEWQISYTCEKAAPKKEAAKTDRIKSIVTE